MFLIDFFQLCRSFFFPTLDHFVPGTRRSPPLWRALEARWDGILAFLLAKKMETDDDAQRLYKRRVSHLIWAYWRHKEGTCELLGAAMTSVYAKAFPTLGSTQNSTAGPRMDGSCQRTEIWTQHAPADSYTMFGKIWVHSVLSTPQNLYVYYCNVDV